MNHQKKSILSFILTLALIITMIPFGTGSASAGIAQQINMGNPEEVGKTFSFPELVVTGDGIRTILISFTGTVDEDDSINLPDSPSGFTVSDSSSTNKYSKRINISPSGTASEIQAYLRSVTYHIETLPQQVQITITGYDIQHDTFFNESTGHYYQFISDTSKSWTQAYDAAKSMTYMGRAGYLATITSLEEDTFVNTLSGGKTGWLGGTTLMPNAETTPDTLYYSNGFDITNVTSGGWYWACGPEKGDMFYNAKSLQPSANLTNAINIDITNSTYFNWARGTQSYEPNSSYSGSLYTASDFETCLTTLQVSGNIGKHNTLFSWNDRQVSGGGVNTWDAKGYFVEYGDLSTGDSSGGSSAFATATGNFAPSEDIQLTTTSWIDDSNYTCDIDLPGSSKLVTISVNTGTFTVPTLGGVLTYLGGTKGTSYLSSYTSTEALDSATFSYADARDAEAIVGDIIYSLSGSSSQTITATSSTTAPAIGDLYFQGHFYRYIPGNISWVNAVVSAGAIADPYFGGRGYIATATSQPENSILLKLVDTGGTDGDHWHDAWLGGLWQRTSGGSIVRGTEGGEITYGALAAATLAEQKALLPDYQTSYPSSLDASYKILTNSGIVQYYWIDGPEAGLEIANNTEDFAPWHVDVNGIQDEPNFGDFIYIGWQGAYWDDLSAYISGGNFNTLGGYIVEFSGFDGGDKSNIIKSTMKTISPYVPPAPPASGSSSKSNDGAPVIVNGTTYTAGTASRSTEDGKSVTTVTVQTDKLERVLDSQGDNPSVIIPISGTPQIAAGVLTGQMVKDMEDREATLSLQTGSVTYTMPASEINIDAVSGQLGANLSLSDITLQIRIAEPAPGTVKIVEGAAAAGGFQIMVPAVDFHITATYQDKTVPVQTFNSYVQRTVLIPKGVDPEKITTAIVVKPDGTSYHVPTRIIEKDGRQYAVINSLTNSTYTVIWNPVTFADASSHWAKDAINEMGSRKVVTGVTSQLYEPNRNITRAEFAAMVVRGLGLDQGLGTADYKDVSSNAWYRGVIETASGYGIIKGYGDKTFQPNQSITREQAMTMLARAMKITKLEADLTTSQVHDLLQSFSDKGLASSYAKESIAQCLQTGIVQGRTADQLAPEKPITRAEVAVMIQRLLEKSDLI